MLKMVDGTGIIGVDMICPLGVSTPQPPNYDKVEVEGTGMLVLPNSLDAPLERLELGGKTEQVQTSGKQMLNEELLKSLSNYTSNGSDYYYYRISGLEVGKKYTISRGDVKTGKNALLGISVNQESTNKAKFLVYDGLGTGYNNASITWEQTTGEYVDILFSVSGSVTSTTQERLSEFWGRISYVQLEKGTTATPYEPYTGGKPSPSQEYPQEIKNSGKWNKETQKYEVGVKITGKNLLNTYEKGEKDSEYYSVNEDGSLNQKKEDNRSFLSVPATLFLRAGKYYFSLFNSGITFRLYDADANAVLLVIEKQESVLVDLEKDTNIKYKVYNSSGTANNVRVMVSTNKETDYVPCKEPQTLTLTSDRPLTKWDRLVEQGGQIGWLYGAKRYVVTGSELWIFAGAQYYSGISTSMYANAVTNVEQAAVCERLKYEGVIWNKDDKQGFCLNSTNQLHIRFFNEILGVADEATKEEKQKAYIAYLKNEYEKGTPYEIVYQSSETEFIPLPQSEQNAIRALKTYYPTTVITADGGELDPDIKVTYRKEI